MYSIFRNVTHRKQIKQHLLYKHFMNVCHYALCAMHLFPPNIYWVEHALQRVLAKRPPPGGFYGEVISTARSAGKRVSAFPVSQKLENVDKLFLCSRSQV